ncbi:MAG TPA: hypothetical protein DCD99_13285 [Acinetobacter schindleri]|nr:hypothetical protein [Acinetobacter schindleri]
MDRVDYLNSKKNSSATLFDKYLKVSSSEKYSIIFLIEGDDEPYYRHCIEPAIHTQKPFYFFRCNGRDKVCKLHEDISESYDEKVKNSLYYCFIDKDFHDHEELDSNKFYITPSYSYENFYCSENFLLKVVKAKFHLDEYCENHEDLERLQNYYYSRLDEYIQILKLIDQKLRANFIHNKFYPSALKSKLRANDISINDIVIKLEKIEFNKTIDSILPEYFSYESLLSFAIYESYFFYLHNERKKYLQQLRGKFLIYFQISFFKIIFDDFKSSNPTIFTKRKELKKKYREQRQSSSHLYDLNFNRNAIDSFVDTFCSFADIPDCLRTFIAKIKLDYDSSNNSYLSLALT